MFLNDSLLLLKDLVSFPSVKSSPEKRAPFGKSIQEILTFTLNAFSDLGGESTNLDGYCGFSDFGQGEMFGILLHLDVVPAYEERWISPPFVLTRKEDKLYGRGTIDNKGSVAAIYAAIKTLLLENHAFKKKLRVIFGCDEESGWECINHYLKKEKLPSSGFAPDASFPVINYEKGILHFTASLAKPKELLKIEGGSKVNVVADKASIFYSSKPSEVFLGKAAHASTPWLGENAILKMIKSLSSPFPSFQKIISLLSSLESLFEKGSLTTNLGLAYSNTDSVFFDIDIRYPKETSGEDLLKQIKTFIKIEQGSIKDKPPLFVQENNPLVKNLLNAYNSIEKTNAKPITIGGGTYARALNNGVAFGPLFPGEEEVAHMDNEFISIKSLEKCIKIYHYALKKLC